MTCGICENKAYGCGFGTSFTCTTMEKLREIAEKNGTLNYLPTVEQFVAVIPFNLMDVKGTEETAHLFEDALYEEHYACYEEVEGIIFLIWTGGFEHSVTSHIVTSSQLEPIELESIYAEIALLNHRMDSE